MSSKRRPATHTPSGPPGPPAHEKTPFWLAIAGKRHKAGNHARRGLENSLPKNR